MSFGEEGKRGKEREEEEEETEKKSCILGRRSHLECVWWKERKRQMPRLLRCPSSSLLASCVASSRFEWLQKFARERIGKVPKPKDKATAAAASLMGLAQEEEPYTDPDTIFKDELAMVDQMVELLPQQINRVFHQNANIKG